MPKDASLLPNLLFKAYWATQSVMHNQLNFLPFQIVFINNTRIYIGWQVVDGGETQSMGYSRAQQVLGEMAQTVAPLHSECHKIQLSSSYMAYIRNQSGGDFQQSGCLYKPTSGIQWTLKYTCEHLTGLKNKPQQSRPVNFWQWCSGNQLCTQLIDGAINWQ